MSETQVIEAGPDAILAFWFEELKPAEWFSVSGELDGDIKKRFMAVHEAAHKGELYHWRSSAQGRLAEIIVLDQFSRNIYRNKKEAFLYDSMAVALTQEAMHIGADKELSNAQKSFLYMPFMHSESLIIHELAKQCFKQPGLEINYRFEMQHQEIIERFGRYPHRNAILGRESSEEELAFLKQPGSSF